jgi:hypothetical protein
MISEDNYTKRGFDFELRMSDVGSKWEERTRNTRLGMQEG